MYMYMYIYIWNTTQYSANIREQYRRPIDNFVNFQPLENIYVFMQNESVPCCRFRSQISFELRKTPRASLGLEVWEGGVGIEYLPWGFVSLGLVVKRPEVAVCGGSEGVR